MKCRMLLHFSAVVFLTLAALALQATAMTEWKDGTLSADGTALLKTAEPQVPAMGAWMLRNGGLVNRGRGNADTLAILPTPAGKDAVIEGQVRIAEGDVAGLVFRAADASEPCYAALLSADGDRVRLISLPWPDRDLASASLAVEHRTNYQLRVHCRDTSGGVAMEVYVDGEKKLEHVETAIRLDGTRCGVLVNNSRARFDDVAAYALENGAKGKKLLSEDFSSLPQLGTANHEPLTARWQGDTIVLTGTLPEGGHGLGAITGFVHQMTPTERHFIPHLSPDEGYVIGDHAFRSPAMIFATKDRALVLIPDLDDLRAIQAQGLNVWMDYVHADRAITVAVGKCRTADIHVTYRPLELDYAGQDVSLRLHVLTSEKPEDIANPWGMAARELWKRWGHPNLMAGGAQLAPLDQYCRYITNWAFEPEPKGWGNTVWQDFTIDGREAGAPVFIVDVVQHPSVPMDERKWREPRAVWNQTWFSTQRCANGLLQYARQIGDKDLERRATLMTEFALAAPQEDGLFPGVYTTGGRGGYQLYKDTPGWDNGRWENSGRRPRSVSWQATHIVDAAFTARLLLEWNQMEPNKEIPPYLFAFADRLLRLQLPSGAYPGWVEPDGQVPAILAEGPESAMSAAFLLELAGAYAKRQDAGEWKASAKRALAYLEEGPVAESRWEDFETYFSCSGWGTPGQKVERNGLFKQNTFSPFWCAEAFLDGYRVLGDKHYLAVGRRCLDDLSMYQQVWHPDYLPAETHGGFGVMNADGEWNDARQSLFAPIYLEYYKETGLPEYFERGVAALRSSFAMLYCPENEEVKRAYESRHKFFGPESYGFMMENIAHGGPGGNPVGVFTIFTWGNGAALASAGKIRDSYGDVYVDVERKAAFGIDGVQARVESGQVKIEDRYNRDTLRVVYSDGKEKKVEVKSGEATAPLKP